MANTFLNLPETGALFRSMSANRYLDDVLRKTKGENFDDYVARIKSFDTAKHLTREGIKSKIQQIGGEALEEMVNVYAEQEGKNVGREAMGKDIVTLADMLADDDIWAAGFWGAIGGSMQGFVMNKMPKWVTQEDGTTKRTTIGEYNKQQVTNKYEEQLGDLKDRLTEFVTAKDNLVKASQTNDEKLYNESINTIFKYNSFNSIVKGVEEQLIDDYSRIMTLTPEEAAQQGFKGDYKQDAANKIQSIRENTAEWNKIQDRYMSQDLDLAGYPETIFQQHINVENNKKIIAEQEFEINKLQADINQSYALKGTDLTIAAYNDIVSSIRALDNDFELETIDLENLLNLQKFDKNTQKRIVAKLNNKYGNLENAKTQIEKNLDNIREKANDLARTFKIQRENFDIQVDPENKLSQEEKDRMFAQILSENEFEIDALTEAKSQLQRNRETLRAQEEELRNLKSKDGVNKFKELKRQKLTEQNERVEQEVVEEQKNQAEAERQAQQEVVADIKRRQEEKPETVTKEETITLQQLEELEKQEGETYQEGQYTGEGSTPKELDKQYEDISDSANKSDEEGKVFDQQGNLIFVDDKLIYSFDKIAYASTVEYSEDETTGVIKHTSLELNPETNPDLLTTKFVAGTPIKIKKLEAPEFKPFTAPRKITFKDELGREVLVANKGELVTFEMLSHPYMQPIGIYDDSNNLIGMLHDVTYVRPERVLQQSLEEDRNNLIALRSKIGNNFIETTIVGKTNGHINQFRDGFKKLSELMPGPIEFAIATSSIQLNTSKTVIVDGLINKPKYKVGQVYAITYTPNGQKIAIPVKTTQVKEHSEVLNELLAAFDAFAEGKISQNQLKEIFSKYIYSTPTSEKLDAAGKNFKREADGKDRMYIDYDSLNVDGIVFGKSGDTKRFLSSRTPKEDIEKLRKIFISILSESYININFEKVRNESFVKNFTTSNVRFYKLPDGRVTVFDNPVISISTSFASGIKPIEKTEEQPRVEPTPQVQTIEEIKNSIAQLRAQEQAEYAAMSDPNDTVEKERIYNKYDELITPLLNQAEADIEARREEELNKEFGRNLELVKSGQKSVISRTPDLVKLSSDPQVSDTRAQEVIDKYNAINAKYKAELDAVKEVKPATTVQATPVSTDAKADIERRIQEELNRQTPIKNEKITVDTGIGEPIVFQVITYKDGSVGISANNEKSKRYEKLSNEAFQDYLKFNFELGAKGIIKTELVKDDYTDQQSQEIRASIEKSIRDKYAAPDAKADINKKSTKVISSEIVEKGNRKGQTITVTQTNSLEELEGTIVSVTEYEAKVGDTIVTLGGRKMTFKEFKEEFPLDEDYEEILSGIPDLNDDTVITVRKVKRTHTSSRFSTVVSLFSPVLGGKMDVTIKKDNAKYDAELAALEPTIQPEETKTTFTSNNGLEFDIDFEDDTDLLPMFTEVKPGVQELFDSNPELASIGTLEQYSQYLDSVFPDSQVKDVVYHVGYNIIKEFTKRDNGIFFTDNLEYAKNLIIEKIKRDSEYAGYTMSTEEAKKALKVYSVLLNSSNIKNLSKVNSQIIKDLKKENFDTVKGIEDGSNEIESYVVFEPEQIHILGTNSDIERFKQFVESGKQIEKSLSLQDKVNNLIQEGKITKFCK
jgi:hypothetical protein